MTRTDALNRAKTCETLAQAATDRQQRDTLNHMRLLWLTLAEHADKFQNVDAEFDRLITVQTELTVH